MAEKDVNHKHSKQEYLFRVIRYTYRNQCVCTIIVYFTEINSANVDVERKVHNTGTFPALSPKFSEGTKDFSLCLFWNMFSSFAGCHLLEGFVGLLALGRWGSLGGWGCLTPSVPALWGTFLRRKRKRQREISLFNSGFSGSSFLTQINKGRSFKSIEHSHSAVRLLHFFKSLNHRKI